MTTLVSAAMIVRDEAHVLAECLLSIAPVVDEIVVVDTGSRDATRQIAGGLGARVVDFPWCDDFAAARNHALDHATGAWILYIDADERLRGADPSALRRKLDDAGLIAGTVRFHPRTGFTAYPEHRLFRRDPRIRFVGAIHETMMPGITALVASGLGRVGDSGLTIDHIGYDGDQSHKLDRNHGLLRKQIAADPTRPYLWWHLGAVERDLGRIEAAEAAWARGAALAAARDPAAAEDALCAIELVKSRVARGADPWPLLEQAEAAYPGNWLLLWLRGKAFAAERRDAEAFEAFARLAAVDAAALVAPMSYDVRLFGPFAAAEAGHCAFRLGRFADSAACYRQAGAAGALPL